MSSSQKVTRRTVLKSMAVVGGGLALGRFASPAVAAAAAVGRPRRVHMLRGSRR